MSLVVSITHPDRKSVLVFSNCSSDCALFKRLPVDTSFSYVAPDDEDELLRLPTGPSKCQTLPPTLAVCHPRNNSVRSGESVSRGSLCISISHGTCISSGQRVRSHATGHSSHIWRNPSDRILLGHHLWVWRDHRGQERSAVDVRQRV